MDNKTVTIKINGVEYTVDGGSTILEACRKAGIEIPTLCYMEDVCDEGSCGICVVEVLKARTLQRACITQVFEGMDIKTNTPKVRLARKTIVELILANHPKDCLNCSASEICELRKISYDLGVTETPFEQTKELDLPLDLTSPAIVRDLNKCILCRRCVKVCEVVQSVNVIDIAGRGINSRVSCFMDKGIGESYCTNCGQCIKVCPVGALTEKSDIGRVWDYLSDPTKHVVVQTAPAVRVAIGEEFGMPVGSLVTGQMAAGLRRLGFNGVFDTDFSADLTIMEEGTEFLGRLTKVLGGEEASLPVITSCSPGWIKFIEHYYPKCLPNVSSCKSPQQMFGAVSKTYYAEKMGLDPRNIICISIMPCTAKKYECLRPELDDAFDHWKDKLMLKDEDHFQDVDAVLTTRELGRMMKEGGIDFVNLPDESFDSPLGESTGAAVIFGATGGVMEAALRTVYEVVTEKPLPKIELEAVRGMQGIKKADVPLVKPDGTEIVAKVAIASGLGNARVLLEEVNNGTSPYHFIEIMACPGGCLNGGGQPICDDPNVCEKRASAIYQQDEALTIRKSHDNPEIKKIYEDYFEKPNSHKAHELLHTHYIERDIYEQEKE
ncbi:MAG: [FeFe] hydrogenase, group A [Caldisericia bacterium]|nr:[FeFe] hydrogenase, group A [Caldisericia bacterium]